MSSQEWLLPPEVRSKLYPLVTTAMAIPSLIGSAYIIQHVARSPKRRQRVFSRIMLGMSVIDFITAIVDFASQLPVPEGISDRYFMARGTWTTCEIFGFLGQARTVSVLYNGSLQLYFYLTIRCGWKEHRIKPIEVPLLHAVPLVIGWGLAIAALPLEAFNPSVIGCRVVDYPFSCSTNPDVECLRGEHGTTLSLLTRDLPVWTVAALNTIAMIFIYCKLYQLDEKNKSYRFESRPSVILQSSGTNGLHNDVTSSATSKTITDRSGATTSRSTITTTSETNTRDHTRDLHNQDSRNRMEQKLSRRRSSLKVSTRTVRLKYKFAAQAALYFFAFLITWALTTFNVIRRKNGKPAIAPVILINIIFLPLQGFWNALIYIRPRYLRYRQNQQFLQASQRRLQQQQVANQENTPSTTSRLQALALALSVQAEDDEDDDLEEDNSEIDETDADYTRKTHDGHQCTTIQSQLTSQPVGLVDRLKTKGGQGFSVFDNDSEIVDA